MFIDFLLSRKGQELMQRLNYKYSIVEGIAPLDGMPSLDSLNILLPKNSMDYAKNRSNYIREFNTFFQAGEWENED